MNRKLFDVVVIPCFNFVHKDLSVFSDQEFEGALSVNFVVTTEDVLNLSRVVIFVGILVRGLFKSVGPIISNEVKLVRRHLDLFFWFGGELVAAKWTSVAEA